MTNEQIKQNAEQYAIKICEETPIDYNVVSDAYIAGAHSRDEEIESIYNNFKEEFNVLEKQLNQLRNPWLDASKELPKSADEVFIYAGGVTTIGRYIQDENIWRVPVFGVIEDAEYWMPIPKLKGGEV